MNEHITWFDYVTMPNINISLQVGDTSYFTPTVTVGGFSVAGDVVQLGRIKDVSLIDTTALDATSDNGLVNANEAYIDFKDDQAECGWGSDCSNTGIIRINKSYKEAGIIPGMSIDIGVAPSLTSTGTLTNFSSSIYSKQATAGFDWLYVKSVNPNGDDVNEIEIAQYINFGFAHPTFAYNNSEYADITPDNNSDVSTKGLNKLKSLRYSDGVPQYELDEQFQNRPTRVRFTFDNESGIPPYGVYPATGAAYDQDVGGVLSPWYGKTKFWMIVTELQVNYPTASIGDFQMFSKDNAVNMVSPTGYYAQAKLENNSKIKSEMFAVSVDGRASSK